MSSKTKTAILVCAAIAILAGIILCARFGGGQPSPGTIVASSPSSPLFAPKGQLVTGFPQDLILDSNAAVSGSYSIQYSSSTNQYTAEWNSSSSMSDLYNDYKQYLPAHGWAITNDLAQNASSRGIYAQNASSDVSVVIVPQDSGSAATVTYFTK